MNASGHSEQHLKARRTVVPVMSEGAIQPQPAHHEKGHVIDNAGVLRITTDVGGPRRPPILVGGTDQQARSIQSISQPIHFKSIGSAGGGVPTLKQYKRGCEDWGSLREDFGEGAVRRVVPLVRLVPKGEQADRVREYGVHGWCSL